MKLGAAWNVFDGEELLEASIAALRPLLAHVVVVYQTRSNFGAPAPSYLEPWLKELQSRGLIDTLLCYTPKTFAPSEKSALVSSRATAQELGAAPTEVAGQFFNELSKREMGRKACLDAGCTHWLNMDCDEFYLADEVEAAIKAITMYGYTTTAARMRMFFKSATWELLPPDPLNAVPFICALSHDNPLKLAAPGYPVLLDPTRRPDHLGKFHLFERHELEMFHMSFVRRDIGPKMSNVSNKGNYDMAVADFVDAFKRWTPESGVLHPHPVFRSMFRYIGKMENLWGIDLDALCALCPRVGAATCSNCHAVRYCSQSCQAAHWSRHQPECKAGAGSL